MTARAVIEQIKALPPEEQAKVVEFLEEIRSVHEIKTVDPDNFRQSADTVFNRHAELMRKLSQ